MRLIDSKPMSPGARRIALAESEGFEREIEASIQKAVNELPRFLSDSPELHHRAHVLALRVQLRDEQRARSRKIAETLDPASPIADQVAPIPEIIFS